MNSMLSSLSILGAKYLFLVVILVAVIQYFFLSRAQRKYIAVLALISLPIMFILLKLAALLYYDPRPFVVGHFIPLIAHAPDNGFPSDHTILCSAIAAIIFTVRKKTGIGLWVLTFIVGFSRVYVGVHHTMDILASVVIAIATVYCCAFLMKKFKIAQV